MPWLGISSAKDPGEILLMRWPRDLLLVYLSQGFPSEFLRIQVFSPPRRPEMIQLSPIPYLALLPPFKLLTRLRNPPPPVFASSAPADPSWVTLLSSMPG